MITRVFTTFAFLFVFTSISEAQEKNFRLKDAIDALQCAAGKAAQQIGQDKIPAGYSTIKFTITLKQESTNETKVEAGLQDGLIVLFPSASASWQKSHIQKETLAENYSFRKNLHKANTAACNRISNFDTGLVEDIATQIGGVSDEENKDITTNIKSASQVSVTNDTKLAASLGIPIVKLSGSYGRTTVRSLDIVAVSP